MELILNRKFKKPNYTIGSLFLRPSNTAKQALPIEGERGEGLQFFCNTLECPVGTLEEMQTAGSRKAIPPGTYHIRMAWSPKFQERLPLLEDVPGRGNILIHAGNTPHDTTGCILVGLNTHVGKVLQSQKILEKLLGKIREELNKGERVTVTIK